jgi:pyruvate dehydrogenase E1 component beta subunit
MPATARDARDLLIAAILTGGPVVYIDDRWLYNIEEELPPVDVNGLDLRSEGPRVLRTGSDITLVGAGYSTWLCLQAADRLAAAHRIQAEVIDLRVINPLRPDAIRDSVSKTGRLLAVDGGWRTCGLGGEIIAIVAEGVAPTTMKATPARITLPDAPAPVSGPLEKAYYFGVDEVVKRALDLLKE